ncbi:MAG TPA: sigma-54 dependent transcriptional regulator [Candidatus Eisenbacteria bacterium]|nr:sigma-54 dependent transcriptional regulator [Candidatus Eisenbacteria bacterium]
MAAILCVDDESSVCALLDRFLRDMGHEPHTAGSVSEAIEILSRVRIDLLIADCVMPDRDGLQLLDYIRSEGMNIPAIVMSGYSTAEHAQAATRHGAVDFLTKPLRAESVQLAVKSALIVDRLRRENEESRREITSLRGPRVIVGESEALRDLLEALDVVAPTGASVLLHGEVGTRKSLFAREIHARSPRYDQPFVRISFAATPENSVENALFGHEPNAVGAGSPVFVGALERASRGTILLDEVSEIPLHMQGKLLRALQEKRVLRIGGTHPIPIDVRTISTTHRDLPAEVEAGRFSRELYGHLAVVSIRTPPLRERLDDIPRLVETFVDWTARQLGMKSPAIPPETLDYLRKRPWPGNVRELANAVERAMILHEGAALTPEAFGRVPYGVAQTTSAGADSGPNGSWDGGGRTPAEDVLDIRTLERLAIHRALKKTGGHKAKAAELLGINERTLRNKLKAETLPVWVSTSDGPGLTRLESEERTPEESA